MKEFFSAVSTVLHYPLFDIGKTTVTLYGVLGLVFLFALVVATGRQFRRVIIRRVLVRTPLAQSVRFGIERIAGYVFMTLGFYLALQVVGVDLSSLAILAGAVGVGLGFGLQNIFSNFVSGLIILVEQPVAIGDRVEVGGVAGQVVQISLRSTTVVTNDNIAIIVPNSLFISESVTNWSHGDPKVRFRVPLGVAYGTDTERLCAVLLKVAAANPHVLADPEPRVFFIGFGDSSPNFELAVWSADMAHRPRNLHSELNFAIERALRDAGIEIPFPQRDLHIRSGTLKVDGSASRGS